MANLTLTIEDGVLRRARLRALEHGTSVNALVRDHLVGFAGDDEAAGGLREFVQSARAACSESGPGGPPGHATPSMTADELSTALQRSFVEVLGEC